MTALDLAMWYRIRPIRWAMIAFGVGVIALDAWREYRRAAK